MPLQCRQVGNRRPLTELVSFTDEGERVIARLRGPAGQHETCEANYIAGCDGAHSTVPDTIGTAFPGGTYRQVFYVADVEAAGPRSMANCTSISTRPISWASSLWPGKVKPA
jgi:2-polyprenyl-6-methoxyphenol hydroxylase-like FAD-dependent oxidoreductase